MKRLGAMMPWTNSGGGGAGVLVCPRNRTDSDSLCFVSAQIATETATFHITGGTGSLSGASGSGTFSITDLTDLSNENGKFNATINLP